MVKDEDEVNKPHKKEMGKASINEKLDQNSSEAEPYNLTKELDENDKPANMDN